MQLINTVADDSLFGQRRSIDKKIYYLSYYSLKTHYLAFETRF